MCQGGDPNNDGSGGESVYGGEFEDENFTLQHARGALSMANSGPNGNGQQFFVCFAALPKLDCVHVVFGHVERGFDVLDAIEQCGTPEGVPSKLVSVSGCGVLSTLCSLLCSSLFSSLLSPLCSLL
jgi:cyclophilin family peptidyl-prolyl cis-trans isomerase